MADTLPSAPEGPRADDIGKMMGLGYNEIDPPKLGDTSWPALPESVMGIDPRFFRKPDFVTDGVDLDEYMRSFVGLAETLGWVHRRSGVTKFGRYGAGLVVSATGVGALWMLSRYKRIPFGYIGFCTDLSQKVRMLMPGHHCEYNPTHGDTVVFPMTQDYITFGQRAHIIRVHPGDYVVAKVNDQYMLLEHGENHSVGVHMIDDATFEFVSRVKKTVPAILAGPINIITVPPGRIARILLQKKPYLLFEGQHKITSGLLESGGRIRSEEDKSENRKTVKSEKNEGGVIELASIRDSFKFHQISKIYVKPGEIVAIQTNNKATFLSQGDYFFFSDQLEFSKPMSCLVPRFQFMNLTRLFIKENEFVLIQNAKGTLECLGSGCHVIESPSKYLCTIPKTIQYREVVGVRGVTQDPLDVSFNFTMAYRVVEPNKVFLVGSKDTKQEEDGKVFEYVDSVVTTTCQRSMYDIIRQLSFKDMMMLHRVQTEEVKGGEDGIQPGSLKAQFKQVSQSNVKILTNTLRTVFGVELLVEEFGISKLDLANQKEQDDLNRAAFETAKSRASLIAAENTKKLEAIKKEVVEIQARASVSQKQIEAESAGQILSMRARAQADEMRILSTAEAEKISIMSRAEAQAVRERGDAEGHAAEVFKDRTQLQMSEHVSQMFKGMHVTVMDSQHGPFGHIINTMLKKFSAPDQDSVRVQNVSVNSS